MKPLLHAKQIMLMALIYAMIPLGPGIEGSAATMHCLKPEQYSKNYRDWQSCEFAIPGESRDSCTCSKSANEWALLYYAIGIPLIFALSAFFLLRGSWLIKGAIMNIAILGGGVIAAIAANIVVKFAMLSGLLWVVVGAFLASGMLLALYLLTYAFVKVRRPRNAT